ncbi:hypothetical protein ABXN37_26535 [Piscinibacter sakaiensis]|uniref:Uncharacterized protein n=1 Tax=Piscinibacter sakaiensis TaxID=1547922 RepID=A0A0K8P7P5_PISS1|nr:hypothetical protein [Piscinibacter sakaiensis]GAP38663.1 hypothetical protein ISF6_5216 [Piscinibacter sakaiensis]
MNKRTEYIFGVSSLIGLLISVGLTVLALRSGNYAPDAGAMIISLGAVNVVLAIVVVGALLKAEEHWKRICELGPAGQLKDERIRMLIGQSELARNSGFEVARIIHNIQDQLRDRINELFQATEDIDNGHPPTVEELLDLQRTNEMFYLFLVDNLKIMMDLLTGRRCAVTIKIVEGSEGGVFMMRTFMRDAASYRSRKTADSSAAEYPYYDNTAFREILSGPRRSFYVSDNLGAEATYANSNPAWKRLYNATLVCPIRMQLNGEVPADRREYSVLGFLCVDNREGGLDRPDCIELLASVADSLFNHFLMLDHVTAAADRAIEEHTAC